MAEIRPVSLQPMLEPLSRPVRVRAVVDPPAAESWNHTGGSVVRERLRYDDASDFAWWVTD